MVPAPPCVNVSPFTVMDSPKTLFDHKVRFPLPRPVLLVLHFLGTHYDGVNRLLAAQGVATVMEKVFAWHSHPSRSSPLCTL